MPCIELTTIIHAPIPRCFDLARSIDLHRVSMNGTGEKAIAGVTSGLISTGEEVTWRARHFGIVQTMSSKITRFEYPRYFRDEMAEGPFRKMEHDRLFETYGECTIMRDCFVFESPGWIFGVIFNKVILERYLHRLLLKRSAVIKEFAESERWRQILITERHENASHRRWNS